LRDELDGVEKAIRALAYLQHKHPRRKPLAQAVSYCRRQRRRRRYAQAQAAGLPLGSGGVEAACKPVVTQRLNRSGMRWHHPGGPAMLTLRALVQRARFDQGWTVVAQTYKASVSAPDHVVPFPRAQRT
jgi:hypothetical protein